jgi:hypothetical protein
MASLHTVLTTLATFDAESNEDMIRRLQVEAKQHLEATPTGNEDLVAVCRLVFDILNLQDRISQDRHRISSLHGH